MNQHSVRSLVTLVACALASSGCFRLARTSPPVERYVVGGAMLTQADATPSTTPELAIGLRRLDLAPYLATLAIVVRRADNQIVTTGFHRWAEAPSTGLNRAVSGYIANAPGIRSVDVAPWPVRAEHDYLVQLHVTRFEGVEPERGASGEVHLLANWEIIVPDDGAIIARGVTTYRAGDWAVDDYRGLVSRLDLGLLTLSRDVVRCLLQLAPPTQAIPGDSARVAVPRGPTITCSAEP